MGWYTSVCTNISICCSATQKHCLSRLYKALHVHENFKIYFTLKLKKILQVLFSHCTCNHSAFCIFVFIHICFHNTY